MPRAAQYLQEYRAKNLTSLFTDLTKSSDIILVYNLKNKQGKGDPYGSIRSKTIQT